MRAPARQTKAALSSNFDDDALKLIDGRGERLMVKGPRRIGSFVGLFVVSAALAGCNSLLSSSAPPAPAVPAVAPSNLPASQFVGSWGLASYHRAEDRERTEKEAKGQCGKPYVIGAGPNGGVMMHLADQATPSELALKGGDGGRTFIGPANEAAGGADDREVIQTSADSFTTRWVDADNAQRYGTMVYERCKGK
jgi:hypothetical protein